jgi:hypothetical protein
MPAIVRVVGSAISLGFVTFVAGSFLLPSEVRVERRVVIDRPAPAVYGLVEANLTAGHDDGVRRTVVERIPGARVRVELDYGGMGKAFDTVELRPRDGTTEVVRTYEQALGGLPLRRWTGSRLRRLVEAEFERELAKLRADASGR